MPHTVSKKLNKNTEREATLQLLKEFKDINSCEDLDKFFNKFLTIAEKNLILRRVVVMKLINQGKKYREIRKSLDISNNTISNTRDVLEGRGYGKNPNRKRKYSTLANPKKNKSKSFYRRYKGAENILNII